MNLRRTNSLKIKKKFLTKINEKIEKFELFTKVNESNFSKQKKLK